MSARWEAICSAAAGWRRAAVMTCVALATTGVIWLSFAADAASAAGVTTSVPSAGPSLGTAAGNAATSAPRPGITSTAPATTVPPATVYTGPIRPSALGGGVLGRTGTVAKRQSAKSGSSIVAIVVGALGALLVLACAAWALARRRAYEPLWWLSLQHSLGEAGYRTSSTWAEFSDWARRGG